MAIPIEPADFGSCAESTETVLAAEMTAFVERDRAARGNRRAAIPRRDRCAPDASSIGMSVAGSPFVGPDGPIDAPPQVRNAAEAALACGGENRSRHAGERWLSCAIDRPYPALIAARGAAAKATELTDRLLRFATSEMLPRMALGRPILPVLACSPSLAPLLRALERLSGVPLPLVILGETGTGKEVVARAVHTASLRRGPFVAENCAALPEPLLEAELFGSRRGAFTGADKDRRGRVLESDGGTLFLDEIGDLPRALQGKLLRVLQEQEVRPLGSDQAVPVDLRVIAATHHSLTQMIDGGSFRRDLYYRLAGYVCEIPPLRSRKQDLPYLVSALLFRMAEAGLGPGRRLTPGALASLSRREFAGNVRELDNLLRRAGALSTSTAIHEDLFVDACTPIHGPENLESTMILEALRVSGGIKAEAARRLGWSRQKLYRRMEVLGVLRTARDDARDRA